MAGVINNTGSSTHNIRYSTDGITWTHNNSQGVTGIPSGVSVDAYKVIAACFDGANFVFVATASSGMVLVRSTSPTSFFGSPIRIGNTTGSDDTSMGKLVYGNGRYVGISANGNFIWSGTLSAGSWGIQDIIFVSGMFIIITRDSRICTSSDGVDWKFCNQKFPATTSSYGALYTNIGA